MDDARIAKAKQDIQAIETALTMFKLDNFTYPTSEMGLKALVEKPNDPNIKNWRPAATSSISQGSLGQRLPVPESRARTAVSTTCSRSAPTASPAAKA